MINKEIKKKHSSFEFNGLEDYILVYNDRYYSRLIPQRKTPMRNLGYNGIKFLLLSLPRSRCLFTGFIEWINRKQRAIAYLAVRAHFESTASVAYRLRYLSRFYNHEIKHEEIDDVLFKLSLGSRVYPKTITDPNRFTWPDAINVLTQIDAADKLFAEMANTNVKPFRDSYDLLSEFCHPNLLGLTIASDIVEGGRAVFLQEA